MNFFSIRTTIFGIALAPALLFAQEKPFTLKGKIGALDAPAKIYLKYTKGKLQVTDSAVLHQGVFIFKGNIGEPESATLTLRHGMEANDQQTSRKDILWFYVEKGTISITAADSVSKATISGSVTNDYNLQLQADLMPVNMKMREVTIASHAASAEERNSGKWQKMEDDAENERRDVLLAFIKKNPNTIVSLKAIQDYAGFFPEASAIEPLYNLLSGEVKNTQKGKQYAAEIAGLRQTAVGQPAPVFVQNDPDGKPVSLTDFRGRYVLIDFWASWCKPCRAENPNLVKAYHKYKDKNFTILGVSMDNKSMAKAWVKAIADDQLTWTQVADLTNWENPVGNQYHISAIPQNFLIDPQGKIIAKNLKGEELDKRLGEIL